MSLEMVSSIMSTLGAIAGSVASIIAVLVIIFRPVRNAIIRLFSDIDAKKKLYASVETAIKGISEQNLSLLKSGKVKGVRFSTLEAICQHLQCQPGDLLEYLPAAEATSAVGHGDGGGEPR